MEPDTLTPENRMRCQIWRAYMDDQVKDRESRRLAREARENGKDESFVTIGREVHVAAHHLKRAESHNQRSSRVEGPELRHLQIRIK